MNKMPFAELKNNRGQFKIVINHNGHQGCSSITDKFWKCNKQGNVYRKEYDDDIYIYMHNDMTIIKQRIYTYVLRL